MKKYNLLTITLSLFASYFAHAQQERLTGPEAKKHGHWTKTGSRNYVLVSRHQHKPSTGPEAKNNDSKKDSCEAVEVAAAIRVRLYGPEAKNAWLAMQQRLKKNDYKLFATSNQRQQKEETNP